MQGMRYVDLSCFCRRKLTIKAITIRIRARRSYKWAQRTRKPWNAEQEFITFTNADSNRSTKPQCRGNDHHQATGLNFMITVVFSGNCYVQLMCHSRKHICISIKVDGQHSTAMLEIPLSLKVIRVLKSPMWSKDIARMKLREKAWELTSKLLLNTHTLQM